MIRSKLAVLVVFLTVLTPLKTNAGEAEESLIDKIVAAYGGEALTSIKNYKVEDKFTNITNGQGHTPTLSELGSSNSILIRDIENQKASSDSWSTSRAGGNQYATISDGENAYNINYQAGTFGEAGNADPYVFAGGTMRTSDALLVHQLNTVRDKATLGEDAQYMNRMHHVVTMPFPSSPDLNLYIDSETFLVSKMVRVNPQLGDLEYVFSDYKKNSGITYASGMSFYIGGVPNIISNSHELSFNNDLASEMFELADGLEPEGERIDTSEMRATKISGNVYHVGQGNAYTLFISNNVGITAAGGYPGLTERLERFQSEIDNYLPLSYQIVTHHHSDHIGGVGEAVNLGARLVTVAENTDAIRQSTSVKLTDRDFVNIGKRATFGSGRDRVEVYEVSTIHAASFLVTYVPAAKTIFIADHFGSSFEKAIPVAGQSTVDMLAALEELELDIKTITTAHNARIFTMADLKSSVAAFTVPVCSGNRPVCNL